MPEGIDVQKLIALADRVRAKPALVDERLELVTSCDGLPWLGHVPTPTETCIISLRDLKPSEVIVEMGISSMEVPSAVATVYRRWPKAVVAMSDPGQPDPRLPLRSGIVLWRFDGVKASPALDPPSTDGSAAIAAAFEGLPWAPPPMMYEAAAALAQVTAEDLLASMVHPPAMPAGRWHRMPGMWERYLQAWCCLGLLHQQPQQPWKSSRRRQLLVELAFGVEDWITEAALYALVAAAWVDPACRSDVAGLVEDRFVAMRHAAQNRPQSIGVSVAQLAYLTPGMPKRTLQYAVELAAERDRWPGNTGSTANAGSTGSAAAPPQSRPKSLLDRLRRR